MATAVITSFLKIIDEEGRPYSGAKVNVYQAGTTTPVTVYSNSGLSVTAANPIICDSAGQHAIRYIANASYKIAVTTSADVALTGYSKDNIDPGVPIGAGALAIANGGTGATSAAAARTSLGAAASTAVTALSTDVATLQAALDALPTFGDLAGEDTVTGPFLPAGSVVKSDFAEYTSNAAIATVIAYDDTIPQIGEGTQIISLAFTPTNSSNKLRIRFNGEGANSTSGVALTCGLFKNSDADALVASGSAVANGDVPTQMHFSHQMTAGSTSSITFSVRVGTTNATMRMNGTSAARRYGGASRSVLIIEEIKV